MTEQPKEKPKFDTSKLNRTWKTQPETKSEIAPAQSLPSLLPLPAQRKSRISWRVWGGWLLAGFSWSFFITYLLMGVIR